MNSDIKNTLPAMPSNFLSHLIQICWISNHSDTSPRPEILTVKDLAKRFARPQTNRGHLSQSEYHALDVNVPAQSKIRKDQKNGAAFIASTFTQPNVRGQNFVDMINGFVLDFDGMKDDIQGVTRAEFEAKLVAMGYLAYTSYSHRPTDERWRVFIPYSVPCSVDHHSGVHAYFCALFQDRMDGRSKWQMSFSPSHMMPRCLTPTPCQ